MNTISVGWVQPEHTLIIHTFGAVWRRSQTRALRKNTLMWRGMQAMRGMWRVASSVCLTYTYTLSLLLCALASCPAQLHHGYGLIWRTGWLWLAPFFFSEFRQLASSSKHTQINIKACSSFIEILSLLRSHLTVKMLKYSSHEWASEHRDGVSLHFFSHHFSAELLN